MGSLQSQEAREEKTKRPSLSGWLAHRFGFYRSSYDLSAISFHDEDNYYFEISQHGTCRRPQLHEWDGRDIVIASNNNLSVKIREREETPEERLYGNRS